MEKRTRSIARHSSGVSRVTVSSWTIVLVEAESEAGAERPAPKDVPSFDDIRLGLGRCRRCFSSIDWRVERR